MEMQSFYQQLRFYYKALVPLFEKPKVGAYTMFILSFFTIAFFGTLAIKPTLVTIVQLKKQIEDNRIVNEKMDDKINKLRLADVAYRDVQADLPAIFESLPNKPQTALLLGKLNRIFTENNIDILILQFDPINITPPNTDPSSASMLTFTLTGKASYQDALKFISLLSSMDRIVVIDSVNMQAQTGEDRAAFSQGGGITLTIRGKAYTLWGKKENG